MAFGEFERTSTSADLAAIRRSIFEMVMCSVDTGRTSLEKAASEIGRLIAIAEGFYLPDVPAVALDASTETAPPPDTVETARLQVMVLDATTEQLD